jgi:hypothetical protein
MKQMKEGRSAGQRRNQLNVDLRSLEVTLGLYWILGCLLQIELIWGRCEGVAE